MSIQQHYDLLDTLSEIGGSKHGLSKIKINTLTKEAIQYILVNVQIT